MSCLIVQSILKRIVMLRLSKHDFKFFFIHPSRALSADRQAQGDIMYTD